MITKNENFVWCTYRNWSFEILDALIDLNTSKCVSILTTKTCVYDFSKFEKLGIKVFRMQPKLVFKNDSPFMKFINEKSVKAIFFYGWSWLVPAKIFNSFLCLTLHPGLLPNDRGGSPIQNQILKNKKWTYANLIELGPDLDKGDIFDREKIILDGDANDVWQRMTSAGVLITRRFLKKMAANEISRIAQPPGGNFYYRVTSKEAVLKPTEQSALEMHNIVRAHNENDPNGYVSNANIIFNKLKIIIRRSTMKNIKRKEYLLNDVRLENIFKICHQVNNSRAYLVLHGIDKKKLFITQFQIKVSRYI